MLECCGCKNFIRIEIRFYDGISCAESHYQNGFSALGEYNKLESRFHIKIMILHLSVLVKCCAAEKSKNRNSWAPQATTTTTTAKMQSRHTSISLHSTARDQRNKKH